MPASAKSAYLSIKNFTRHNVAGLPFKKIADDIAPDWEISLVFVGPKKARELNKQLRNKEYIPNVLSYRLDGAVPDVALAKSGEIFICPSEAAKQAPDFQLSAEDFLLFLFIHGVLHIQGWDHGVKMETCERKILKRYVSKDSDRH